MLNLIISLIKLEFKKKMIFVLVCSFIMWLLTPKIALVLIFSIPTY